MEVREDSNPFGRGGGGGESPYAPSSTAGQTSRHVVRT